MFPLRPPTAAPPGRRRLLAAGLVTVLGTALAVPALAQPGEPPAAEPTVETVPLGEFEEGLDSWTHFGAEGGSSTLTRTTDDARTGQGAASLGIDVEGGGFVAMERNVADQELAAESISLSVRSDVVTDMWVRVVDDTNQTIQQRVTLDPTTDGWQDVELSLLELAPGSNHWGGAADGVFHPPLRTINVNVASYQIPLEQRVEPVPLLVDDVSVEAPLEAEASALALTTTTLGNIFEVGNAVEIGLSTTAETVAWTVRDMTGAVVETGSAPSAELDGTLPLEVGEGWFEVDVTAEQADGTISRAGTDVAVLKPFDLSGSTNADRVGVATHFGTQPDDYDTEIVPLIATAGLGHARDEAWWWDEEETKGVYAWPQKTLDFAAAFEENDIDLFSIFSYGNTDLYPAVGSMTTDEGRLAYGEYVKRTVAQFDRGEDSMYEVWNEWNTGLGGPCPAEEVPLGCQGAENYFHTLKTAYEAAKSVNPDAFVAGPTIAGYNGGWLSQLFAAGGLDYLDAVTFHPYSYPGGAEGLTSTINDVNRRMDEHGQRKPIVISELGWPTGSGSRAVDETDQAQYLVRSIALALTQGVERYTIYGLMDNGLDDGYTEDRFGLIRNQFDPRGAYLPKPSYVAVSNLTRAISDREALELTDLGEGGWDAVFGPSGDSDALHVLWSTQEQTATVTASGPVTITDLAGVESTYTPDASGKVYLAVGAAAVYVEGDVEDVEIGSPFSLVAGTTVVGEDVEATFTADNTGGTEDLELTVQIEGQTLEVSVPAGQSVDTPITLPGLETEGSRSYVAVVESDGEPVARLTAVVEFVPAADLEAVHAMTADGEHVLRLRVANDAAADLDVTSLTWDVAGEVGSDPDMAGGVVPGETVQVIDVPITPENPEGLPYTVVLTTDATGPVEVTGTLLPLVDPVQAVPHLTVVVDGVVDDAVAALAPIDLATDASATVPGIDWTGAEDLSGRLWYTWDEEFVYFTADIVDDVHAQQYSGGDMWNGDSIQLTFSAGTPGEMETWSELGIAFGPTGPTVHRWQSADGNVGTPPGVESAVVRDEETKRTTYELAVPWDSLRPQYSQDRLLSTSVAINEDDGVGRTGWYTWGEGIAAGKDATLFNPARLDPAGVVEPSPTLTVDPGTVRIGETLRVSGSGFPQGATVDVTYVDAAGSPVATGDDEARPEARAAIAAAVVVGEDGTVTEEITIPEGTALGTLTVTATAGELVVTATAEVAAAVVGPEPTGGPTDGTPTGDPTGGPTDGTPTGDPSGGPSASAGADGTRPGGLSDTGADVALVAGLGVLLLALGGALVARRRAARG